MKPTFKKLFPKLSKKMHREGSYTQLEIFKTDYVHVLLFRHEVWG